METAWKAMLSPQIDVLAGDGSAEKAFDWGLGVGLQTTEKGPGVWHWGDNGEFQAYFEILPAEKRGLIVFLNGANGQAVSRAVTEAVLGLSRPAIATAYFNYPSIGSPELRMLKGYLSGGFEGFAQTAEAGHGPERERAINQLGYALLQSRKRKAAIEVFRYNMSLYPKSANTHDSLAEAYLAVGDRAKAVDFYEKALAIDPHFPSAVEALRRLKGGRP
jgi:tetratricopeptide (TPR) repeat protein